MQLTLFVKNAVNNALHTITQMLIFMVIVNSTHRVICVQVADNHFQGL